VVGSFLRKKMTLLLLLFHLPPFFSPLKFKN
jgi:hypothetical protein